GDPDATARAFDTDGWLRTGDEGMWSPHRAGAMYFVTGRLKEIIIRGGEKLAPPAIERRLLAELPELEGRLVVLGFPHRVQGEEIGAYVELDALPVDLERK